MRVCAALCSPGGALSRRRVQLPFHWNIGAGPAFLRTGDPPPPILCGDVPFPHIAPVRLRTKLPL
jgi:hypothetical protein